MKRVVVTGAGCVTPVGNSLDSFCAALKAGKSGFGSITKFDTTHFPVHHAFETKGFKPSPSYQGLDPFIQYGLNAAEQAIQDSGIDIKSIDPYRIGIAVSSSKGGMTTLEKYRDRFLLRPSALLAARVYANLIPNILSQWIARRYKVHGPAKPAVAACATGTMALIEGIRMIEDDEVDICIAGASDASLTKLMLGGYNQMGVLSPDGIRPFDATRNGFVVGEGAGIVILESKKYADSRKARAYASILSYAYGFEANGLIEFPDDGNGLSTCLRHSINKAEISAADIDTFQLHGTATRSGDRYETAQFKKAFGKTASKISLSAIKSMIGHTVGASGALSFISTLLSLRHQFVPPTINLNHPDPECDLDYTANRPLEKKIRIAGSLAMGFGGQMAAILVGNTE